MNRLLPETPAQWAKTTATTGLVGGRRRCRQAAPLPHDATCRQLPLARTLDGNAASWCTEHTFDTAAESSQLRPGSAGSGGCAAPVRSQYEAPVAGMTPPAAALTHRLEVFLAAV